MTAGSFLGSRIVVAGTHSGVGKTTVATGLMAALRRAGHRPAGAKVGPDFIDPGYHSLATGRPPRNLDAWLCGAAAMVPLAARASGGSDVLVVEGVMGLFDGASDGTASSTADVARLLDAPVVLVVDASAMSDSVAALVHGYATFDPGLRLAGVILNRVGSAGHETLLREALAPVGVPVLGALRRDDAFAWRDRHLGLVPVAEGAAAVGSGLARLAHAVAENVDVEGLFEVACSARSVAAAPVAVPDAGTSFRVAVAAGKAFTFTYADTLDALRAAGGEVIPFDPLVDCAVPDGVDGLLAGGGFPEVYGAELAANRPLLESVRAAVGAGLPTWAECGGLLLLCRRLDGHELAGVVPAEATMTQRLTLGYRVARTLGPTPLGRRGTRLRGHEFHYSELNPAGGALELENRWGRRREGFSSATLIATYLHHHPGGDPGPVSSFAAACALRAALRSG